MSTGAPKKLGRGRAWGKIISGGAYDVITFKEQKTLKAGGQQTKELRVTLIVVDQK